MYIYNLQEGAWSWRLALKVDFWVLYTHTIIYINREAQFPSGKGVFVTLLHLCGDPVAVNEGRSRNGSIFTVCVCFHELCLLPLPLRRFPFQSTNVLCCPDVLYRTTLLLWEANQIVLKEPSEGLLPSSCPSWVPEWLRDCQVHRTIIPCLPLSLSHIPRNGTGDIQWHTLSLDSNGDDTFVITKHEGTSQSFWERREAGLHLLHQHFGVHTKPIPSVNVF